MKGLLILPIALIVMYSGCLGGSQFKETPSTTLKVLASNATTAIQLTTTSIPSTTLPVATLLSVSTTKAHVTTTSTTLRVPEGIIDPDFEVVAYDSALAWNGTNILSDNHVEGRPRIVELNMYGEIIWEYVLPSEFKDYTNPGFDVELLPSGTILFVLPRKGVYEIDRQGSVVWSFPDTMVSHDADRLANGNTLIAFGSNDRPGDLNVREVDPRGKLVWSWSAKNEFYDQFKGMNIEGWTHTNAVERLSNGNTLVSLRNFDTIVEVNPDGGVVQKIAMDGMDNNHDPEQLGNGNILYATHAKPQRAVELENGTWREVWNYTVKRQMAWPLRDADRLPNGNTLITGSTVILEVTRNWTIAWQLNLKTQAFDMKEASQFGFYKTQRAWQTP
ncbi:MAG: aryl-sulfate sulfotransferase [Candidatus Altiarchaeota archaeon]|nr:aryl-sulfate sulfotransferase [Candidatus Altiarchaeota archaeon]